MRKALLLTTASMALAIQIEAQVSAVKMTAAEFAKKLADITEITAPETHQNDSVAIWPHELKEFDKHLQGATSARFNPEEQAENIKRLIKHWIDRETEEFERPLQNPEEIWQKSSNRKTWDNVGFLSYAEKGTNGKTVICIPTEHTDETSDARHFKRAEKIQAEARKIMTRAHEIGAETFTTEGYAQKEWDENTPSIGSIDFENSPELKSEYTFDAEFDVRTFGLIDIKTEDSLRVILNFEKVFLDAAARMRRGQYNLPTLIKFMEEESQNFQNLENINFTAFIEKMFGTTRGNFSIPMQDHIIEQFEILKNKFIYFERNQDAVEYVEKLGASDKTNAIVLNYGAGHFQEKNGKTIQEMLREKGFSVVIVEIPMVHEKYPVFRNY